MQVQNKLDGCYYAVKRIQVNPASKQFRRIKGEVTLLSRLNHENIVRYYNAWIERHETPSTGVVSNTDSSETQSPLDQQTPQGSKKAAPRLNELGLPDDAEDLAPPLALSSSVEWSTSIEKSSSARCSGQRSSDEEDDDDDDEDVFGASFLYVFLLVFYSFLSDLCKIDFIFFFSFQAVRQRLEERHHLRQRGRERGRDVAGLRALFRPTSRLLLTQRRHVASSLSPRRSSRAKGRRSAPRRAWTRKDTLSLHITCTYK